MVRGMYIAGTGMLLQRRRFENITNNITNAETIGYKKDHLVSHNFDDVLLSRLNDTNVAGYSKVPGILTYGTLVDQKFTNFEMGHLEETGLSTDLALVGDAFFVLNTPNGERYTKSGVFVVNSEGYLTDGDGNYLMGANGRIRVNGDDFVINEAGDVFVGDERIDTLRMVTFNDNDLLRKQGNNLFDANGAVAQAAQDFAVKQGFVENSNVEIGREMVDMLATYRAYETNQRMLTMIDETVGKAVNEIASLR